MSNARNSDSRFQEENVQLRANVAQLEDRLDHMAEHGSISRAVHEMESIHRVAMEVVSDAVLIADEKGRLAYASPNAHFLFGHTQADIMQQGKIGFLLPAILVDFDTLEERGEIANIECQIRDSLGRARELLVTVKRVDVLKGSVMYVCRDVTERKRIESNLELLTLTLERRIEDRVKKLRDSLERYRRMVEELREDYFFYATDPDSNLTYISPSILTIMGYRPEEVVGRNWRDFVDQSHPSFTAAEESEKKLFEGRTCVLYGCAAKHANGEIRYLEVRNIAVRDEDGNIIASEGICKDVTDRIEVEDDLRRAHEELEQRVDERTGKLTEINDRLRRSEQRYRSVVEDCPDFIVRWKGDGVRLFVNQAYCEYVGATREQLIGTSFMSSVVESDRGELRQMLRRVSPDHPCIVHEHRVQLPDGRIMWHRWSNRALFDEDGQLTEFQAVGCDITDRRKLEQHARQRAVAEVRLLNLTPREQDVMGLVVLGDANKVIARKLGLSVKTIEKHRSSLMRKLQVRSVPELVRLAMLVEDGPAFWSV